LVPVCCDPLLASDIGLSAFNLEWPLAMEQLDRWTIVPLGAL
jgi:hypothetical protein